MKRTVRHQTEQQADVQPPLVPSARAQTSTTSETGSKSRRSATLTAVGFLLLVAAGAPRITLITAVAAVESTSEIPPSAAASIPVAPELGSASVVLSRTEPVPDAAPPAIAIPTPKPMILADRSTKAEPVPAEPPLPSPICPTGTFLDDGACIHLPEDDGFGEDPVGAPEGEPSAQGHHEKTGKWVLYDQIPRRPDRPSDYQAYVYPIPPGLPNGRYVISGYDLDQPDHLQRRGKMNAVGHGAVDLPQRRGTPIKMLNLDHQIGDALVIYVGKLMGQSVVTRHLLREGGREREYVLIFGHLQGAAAGLRIGSILKEGELVGFVGDTGSPELVHLHLEARRVRDGVDGSKLLLGRILARDATIVCDPRNVLPLRGEAR